MPLEEDRRNCSVVGGFGDFHQHETLSQLSKKVERGLGKGERQCSIKGVYMRLGGICQRSRNASHWKPKLGTQ